MAVNLTPNLVVQKLEGGVATFFDGSGVVEKVKEFPQVSAVIPRVWGFTMIHNEKGEGLFTVMGLEEFSEEDELPSLKAGRWPEESGEGVVGLAVSHFIGVEAGQTIKLTTVEHMSYPLKVVGIMDEEVQIYGADLILTTNYDARKILNIPEGKVSEIGIYLYRDEFENRVANALQGEFHHEYRIITRNVLSDLMQTLYQAKGGVVQLLWLIVFITVLIIAWAESANISLHMKREVGILKAVGWGTADVIQMKFWENLLIGLIGTLTGLGLSFGYLLMDAPGMKSLFLGWAKIYPEFPLPVEVSGKALVVVLSIGILPLVVATLIPAWLVGIIEPDEAIRG
jgi:ABC-type lipoprotein release transport system permease subunit